MRYIFYSIVILVIILIFFLIGLILYWAFRAFVDKHTATVISRILMMVIIGVILIASFIGNKYTRLELEVTHTEVVSARLPKGFDGYRIAQISDFHLDSFDSIQGVAFIERMIDSFEAEQPDIIVFTGDLVSIQSAQAEPFKESLKRMAHIPSQKEDGTFIPIYSILGNHDYADYTHKSPRERYLDVERLCTILQEAGWRVLRNEAVFLHTGDAQATDSGTIDSILLVGVENIGEPPFSTYGDLKKSLSSVNAVIEDLPFTCLLSHNPTHWRSEVLPTTGIDLTLSGHTHAMQLKIGDWSPSGWKYPEWGGLYEASSIIVKEGQILKATSPDHPQYLYVNTGIGGVGPRVRIGVRPEISILNLKSSD